MGASPEQIHVVGAAIFDGRGRVLVAQRSAEMALPLLWEFPGGKVEPGESPEEALAREVEEELGLEVTVGEFVARGSHLTSSGRRVVLDVYRARLVAGRLVLVEHADARWCAPDELRALDWPEADLPAVEVLAGEQ